MTFAEVPSLLALIPNSAGCGGEGTEVTDALFTPLLSPQPWKTLPGTQPLSVVSLPFSSFLTVLLSLQDQKFGTFGPHI